MFILEPKSLKQLVHIPTFYCETLDMDKISFVVLGGIALGGKELMDSRVAHHQLYPVLCVGPVA